MKLNIYPFFLECSKYCNLKYKKTFQNLAFGKGGHIINKKGKNILVTTNGEFIIPIEYSESARVQLEKLLWSSNQAFEEIADQIQKTRLTWSTIRKKDKANLLYQHISLMDLSTAKKANLCSLIMLALFLKLINQNDIIYDGKKVSYISEDLMKPNLHLRITENELVTSHSTQ